ncbi:NPC intracellular cholesterol transporter 2 [Lamellibrachia satsuma]|nr:NPC intracellular cholesterol transporter 2 [Lamellibrachia satsuma]
MTDRRGMVLAGSKFGKVADIQVKGCIKSETICVAKKGTNVTFSAAFTPNEKVEKMAAIVHGIVAGIPVPFPLPNPDACKDSGLQCPLTNGKAVNYMSTLPIKKEYPAIRVVVRWELKDQNAKDVVCIEMGIEIQN